MKSTLSGLIENLSNKDYHSAKGISKSGLDQLAISPLAYWDTYLNPNREPQEYKHCFAIGDGTHKLVLEEWEFEKYYAVGFDKSKYPDALDTVADLKKELSERNMMVSGSKPELADRLVNECGYPAEKIMCKLESLHNKTIIGRTEISAIDYRDMTGMLHAVNRHHTAGKLIKNCYAEQSYFVTDLDGVIRKCRPDIITNDGWVVADLKTTDDVSPTGFGRTIAQRRYHVQAAWYLDILKMLYGDDAPTQWAFIAAQKKRPYDVAVHYLTDDQIAIGRALYRLDLKRLYECHQSNVWHGVDNGNLIEAILPAWEMNRVMEY